MCCLKLGDFLNILKLQWTHHREISIDASPTLGSCWTSTSEFMNSNSSFRCSLSKITD